MYQHFRSLLGAAAALTLVASAAQAQAKAEDRPNASRGAANAAQDENIRVATGRNTPGAAGEQAPSQKAPAGTASRGYFTTCSIEASSFCP